ncbi:MAG: response regulator transcription factor [Deltaproteobacteria bacterium]|nr:response regulator transcription factor [Deltaproteobacteria bacterium]
MKKKSVLVVDDHPLVREGLKVILGRSTKFEVTGEAGAAAEGFRMAGELKPDLVIVDISLPDESGIELTRRIKRALPDSGILIVSMHSKIDYISEAFKAGATGYMVKESAPERLLSALATIAKGEYYLDTPLSHPVIENLMKSPEKNAGITEGAYRRLTPREQEIMRMLAKDLSVKEIAERLFISAKTVENHRTNIKEKLGLKSSIELARYAARLGLIDVDEWKN